METNVSSSAAKRKHAVARKVCDPGRSKRNRRRGAAVVEFAIVAPLLLTLLFGMLEVGRLVMVQQILTNASREGARRGILEQATATDVQSTVEAYLTNASISNATVSISPGSLATVGFGNKVTVGISVPFEEVSWLPAPWFLSGVEISGKSVMYGERVE